LGRILWHTQSQILPAVARYCPMLSLHLLYSVLHSCILPPHLLFYSHNDKSTMFSHKKARHCDISYQPDKVYYCVRAFLLFTLYSFISVWQLHSCSDCPPQLPVHFPLLGQVAPAGQPMHFTPRFFSLIMYAIAPPTISAITTTAIKSAILITPFFIMQLSSLIHIQLPYFYSFSESSIPALQP